MDSRMISRSKEDYLKAVFIAIKAHGACRNIDISNHLGVSKASACIAVKKLEQDGLIKRDALRILLTEEGSELAEKLYEKDMFFMKWFRNIGVSEKTAREDACMIEHVISEETYSKLRAYLENNQLA